MTDMGMMAGHLNNIVLRVVNLEKRVDAFQEVLAAIHKELTPEQRGRLARFFHPEDAGSGRRI